MSGPEQTLTVRLEILNDADIEPSRRFDLTWPSYQIKVGRGSQSGSRELYPSSHNAWFESRVMSRGHALLTADPATKQLFIEDLGSMHGTFLEERRMKHGEKEAIYRGDIIKFGSEVVRGSETFLPLQVHVSFDWTGDVPLRLPDAPKMTHVQPACNTFTVPDDDDVDDDSDLEIIRESVCAPKLEVLIPSRTYAVPESDISCAGSVSSDDDASAAQSPDTSAVQLEPVSPSPMKIARSRDFCKESNDVTVSSPQPVTRCINFFEEEPTTNILPADPRTTGIRSRSDKQDSVNMYDFATIDMGDDNTESDIESENEFSDDLFEGDELELEAIQSDPPQDEDQDTEEPVEAQNQHLWDPSCRGQTPPTADSGAFQQSQDKLQPRATTARTPSPSDAAMPKTVAPSSANTTAHCHTGLVYGVSDSMPFSMPITSGLHVPEPPPSTAWQIPHRQEWPGYYMPCLPSQAYNKGPFQRNAGARNNDDAGPTQSLYTDQAGLASFVNCDRQPQATQFCSYNMPTQVDLGAHASQTAKKLSIKDILDNESQQHVLKPKTTSVKRKADEISRDDEEEDHEEKDEDSEKLVSKDMNSKTQDLEYATGQIKPIGLPMTSIVESSKANVPVAKATTEPPSKRARTGAKYIAAVGLAGVVVGGVFGSVATVAALVALPSGFFA